MQTQIIIFLFILNVFCLIAIAMLNKWNRQQDEDLLDYGSVSNQQYANLYEEMIQERNKLLDIVVNNNNKTESLLKFIFESLPKKQKELVRAKNRKSELYDNKSEVNKRLTRLGNFDNLPLDKVRVVEQESLWAYRNQLENDIKELESKIETLQKEINA